VRYQIVVMLMIVAATVLSSLLVLHLVRRRCFGTAMNLLLRDE
jgi:putative ABC transport system permease protein